jgi:hypothetical protein
LLIHIKIILKFVFKYRTFDFNMLIKRIKILIALLLFLGSSGFLLSQNFITISDTTVTRSEYSTLSLYGTISQSPVNSLSIEIIYDSRVLDIKSASGGTGMAITEASPDFKTDFSRLDSARITITSNSAASINNGIICRLLVKGLVFSDSVGYVRPTRLIVNGSEVTFNTGTSRIKVTGNLIFPNFPDNLGDAVPNPFFGSTRLNFSLEKPSAISFSVYNMIGLLISESVSDKDFFKVFDAKTNAPINLTAPLKEGGYYLVLSPDYFQVASGYYILFMKTDRGLFNKNLIFNK